MKKAINFDIDTKKYEEITGKKSPSAYPEIKNFLLKNKFEHRQWSGYISKESMNYRNIVALMIKMSMKIKWLKYCVRQIDVTNIGKQHSLINTINKEPSKEELSDMNDI